MNIIEATEKNRGVVNQKLAGIQSAQYALFAIQLFQSHRLVSVTSGGRGGSLKRIFDGILKNISLVYEDFLVLEVLDASTIVLALKTVSLDDAREKAKDVLCAINHLRIADTGESVMINARIGIYYCALGEKIDPIDALDNALLALCQHGSRRIIFFTKEMRVTAQRRNRRGTQIIETLRDRTIASEQLSLSFMPIANARTGQVEFAEALVRWNHLDEKVVLQPNDFLYLVDCNRLLYSLTEIVLTKAIFCLKRLTEAGHNIPIHVNLDPRAIPPDLPHMVDVLLQSHNVEPKLLGFEILESKVPNHGELEAVLNTLMHRGHPLSADDFGVGVSAFEFIRSHRLFTHLKLDSTWTAQLGDWAQIIKAVIDFAHSNNLQVVAEGVGSEETARKLKRLGADYLQGHYLFGEAAPFEKFIQCLQ